MDINALLEYQAQLIEYNNLQKMISQTPEAQNFYRCKKALKAAEEDVHRLNLEALATMTRIDALKNEISELEKQIGDIEDATNGVEDVKACEYLLKKAESLQDSLNALTAELRAISEKQAVIKQEFNAAMKAGKEAITAKKEAEKLYKAVVAQHQATANEIKRKIEKYESELDSRLLEAFKKAKEQIKSLPVVVPLSNKNCGGCFMELSQNSIDNLNTKSIIECQNCGRILYKPNN